MLKNLKVTLKTLTVTIFYLRLYVIKTPKSFNRH